MALSNIFREPRREITESLAGLVAFSGVVWADRYFARWFYEVTGGEHGGCPIPIGYVFGVFAGILFLMVLFGTHALGEIICDELADRGVELRPKNRR